jgi:hypothetical protein
VYRQEAEADGSEPMTRLAALTGLLPALTVAALFAAVCYVYAGSSVSADFKALWLAGSYLAEGRPDLVYPHDIGPFTMLPPPEWIDDLAREGYADDVFPYLYPPLWAWVAGRIAAIADYDTILAIVRPANILMVLAMLALARRRAAPGMPLSLYWLVGAGLFVFTTVGFVPLYQNQPQILVAFLTVLAFERTAAGRPVQGGVWLALAAALKVFPALFVLLWLATGQRRAVASFLVAGLALGVLSVAVAGWPLHADFLHMLRVISGSALVTKLSYTWETTLAGFFWRDHLIFIPEPVPGADGSTIGWFVLAKPAILMLAARLLQLAAVVAVVVLARRHRTGPEAMFLLPFAVALLTMTGPIGWSYYYLASFAFLPALLARQGRVGRIAIVGLALVCLSPVTPMLMASLPLDPVAVGVWLQLAGILAMAAITAAFGLQVARGGPAAKA